MFKYKEGDIVSVSSKIIYANSSNFLWAITKIMRSHAGKTFVVLERYLESNNEIYYKLSDCYVYPEEFLKNNRCKYML